MPKYSELAYSTLLRPDVASGILVRHTTIPSRILHIYCKMVCFAEIVAYSRSAVFFSVMGDQLFPRAAYSYLDGGSVVGEVRHDFDQNTFSEHLAILANGTLFVLHRSHLWVAHSRPIRPSELPEFQRSRRKDAKVGLPGHNNGEIHCLCAIKVPTSEARDSRTRGA